MLNFWPILVSFFEHLLVIICIMASSGFFTLFERKVMGSIQFREGPSKVNIIGLFQPLGDALKLFSKSNFSSEVAVDFMFFFPPLLTFFISLLCWTVFPLVWGLASWYSGVLFVFFCFSVSVYGIILSGWFSRSKFASLGCIRSLSQSVSYEIPLSVGFLIFVLFTSSFSLVEFGEFQELTLFLLPFFFLWFIFFVIFLAEMNRSPFDLAEGESELVSGFSVELGSSSFVAVFLGEYISIVWISTLLALLFVGMIDIYFGFKVMFLMFGIAWVRASFPRVRFDDMMAICWQLVLPTVLGLLLVYLQF